jgi:parallel beta-helix repeat protein
LPKRGCLKKQEQPGVFLMKRIFYLIALVCVFSLSSLAQTTSCTQALPGYYVSTSGSDSNNGSACSPWLTLQHAANVASAGATVRVLPGTYTQNQLSFKNSGTSSARIRFISNQKWGAKIRSTSSYTVLHLYGSYVDIIGFDLAGDSGSCVGIADSGSHNAIVANHVHNILAPSNVCGTNGGAGINHDNYTAGDDDTIGNTVHDIGSWPTLDQRVHGIYHSNAGGHVWNNVVYRCAGFGLHFYHSPSNVTVANNTVLNNVYGGIYVNGASNMLVSNNIVANNTKWGIVEAYGTIGTGDRYLNNLLYNNAGGNIALQSPSTQSGTIIADPQFVNYTGGVDGDYSLKSTSPARDHGTSTGAPSFDADGGRRPVNSAWDMGEFEYGTTASSWPWYPQPTSNPTPSPTPTPTPTPTPIPAPISVSLSPASAALQVGATQQFTAMVSGTTSTGVTWAVNGVTGGNSTTGTISPAGLYTAPAAVPSGGSVTVTATSTASSAASAKATVTVSPAPSVISVSISPTSATVAAGATRQFSASVTGTTNTTIVWQVNGVQGGSPSTGTISASGLYTAPGCPSGSVTVTARSYYDTSKFANAAVTLTSSTASSGYYVSTTGSDSNSGSSCSPWRTLQHAANVAGAGATVHVQPGTYTENHLTLSNSGTSTARIRFVSDQKWGAKIRSTASYTVLHLTGSWVDIMGFDLAGDSGSCVGMADSGSNNRIIGNHVHNIPAPSSVCGSNGGAGIDDDNYNAANDDVIGNFVHDIGSWPTLDARVHGIYHSNAYGHIWNNVVFHCAGFGLHFYHAPAAITVANNTVFNNVYGGIYVNGASNMLVTNNIVVHNTDWGIIEYGTQGTNNRYLDNLVYANGSGNISLWSVSTQSGTVIADPQFVNYTGGADGNYSIQSTSPGRDHGTSSGAPGSDFTGGPRPINSIWDIGGYEYGATPALWPWM